jgi:hypothetical protein
MACVRAPYLTPHQPAEKFQELARDILEQYSNQMRAIVFSGKENGPGPNLNTLHHNHLDFVSLREVFTVS